MIEESTRKLCIDRGTSVVTEVVVQHMKTNKQVSYDSSREMLNTIETPLNVGIGLYIHKRSRSKELGY